jgi:HEAT repeat protein
MLVDPAVEVRWHACGCLHDFGDERAVPALFKVLRHDPDPQVRGTAAYALGGIGSPAAIPALLATLGSDNEYDKLGHSPSSYAATALDDILGTHETRIRMDGGLCRMASWPPDLDRLRCRAEELFQQWSRGRAEPL